jgi:nucleoside-diphosphate-sugar epimerase
MSVPNSNEVTWLIRNIDKKLNVLGFIRDHKSGFFVIGSPTGSYYGGHSESWENKWKELLREGYVSSTEAIKRGLIPKDWTSPKISKQDNEIISKILKGVL